MPIRRGLRTSAGTPSTTQYKAELQQLEQLDEENYFLRGGFVARQKRGRQYRTNAFVEQLHLESHLWNPRCRRRRTALSDERGSLVVKR